MSGKKSWEVANVLDQTEEIQKEIFNEYDKEIEKNSEKINKANEKIEEQKDNLSMFDLKADIDESLNKEYQQLKDRLNEVKQTISQIPEINIFELEKTQKRIKNRLKDENEKAQKIREKIKNTAHYVTEEYNQAQKIKENLQKIRKEYSDLKNNSYDSLNQLSKNITIITSKINELKDIQNQFKDLELKSQKIKEIRNEANSLKKEIQNDFDNIDIQKAQKFTSNKFNQLKQDIQKYKSLSNEDIIKNYPQISSQISKLKIDYTDKYNEFIASQNATKEALANLTQRAFEKKMILLENLVDDIDESITSLEYYDHYKNANSFEEFKEMINQAKEFFEKEDFNQADEILNKATKFYEEITLQADKIRENITSSADLSFKIRDIMLSDEIRFSDAELDMIDNNPINGFKLECRNGDTINFEEIRFDEEGNLIINIDHIENTSGTCGVRWNDMKKVFNKYGIPLMDVRKNGHSVIIPDKETTTQIDENEKEVQNG